MIVVFSSSCKVHSVALFEQSEGAMQLCDSLISADRQASENLVTFCRELLQNQGRSLSDVTMFVADQGPGSFVGVRVAVTLAKTLAYVNQSKVALVSAFDLICPVSDVQIHNRKGEFFLRRLGQEPTLESGEMLPDVAGYGPLFENPTYPDAQNALSLLASLVTYEPDKLILPYLVEPSISVPKTPYKPPQ